ncbi:MAG TPA: BTAD domain-containing putative transcriptional regulator [Longimicrobiales bacterium]|nr:BTAD domain-containing putative transcriptional regulator [Longimicrobiales bacterium]
MLRLRSLGSIGLTDHADASLAPVLRQPKRFALLTYLALARPRGFQRRDSLLALFWPELDDERARAALRQALYTLRRQLPDGVLTNRGDGEVALVPGAVWCDVIEFEERMAAGDLEAALELYRGELLPGFHVPDAAPELGQWMDGERSRLHELAVTAARQAADAAEAADDREGAVRWAARASALAPLDEEAACRAMELRHRAGDRSGALVAFDHWAQRFEQDLGLAPSPATLALVERVRRDPPGRAQRNRPARRKPGQAPVPVPAEQAAAPSAPEPVQPVAAALPPPAVAPASVPRPRRWRLLSGAAGLIAVIGITVLLPLELRWSDGAASPAGSRVTVLPFAYSGAGSASYLSEGLVYLFSVALDGEELRTVDPHRVIRRVGDRERREYDPPAAASLAAEFGTAYFLLGNVVETEGGLQLSASLYRGDAAQPVARATAAGTAAEVLELVDAIAAELLTTRAGAPSRVTRLASVTSHSLPAVKSYLAGERLMRQGRFDAAIDAYEVAVAADSLFALAHYRTSQAASWAFRGELSNRAAAHAARHADRLPERERRLVLGHEAYRRGDAAGSLETLRELSIQYPDDPEVWYRIGEVRMHFGPLHGWPIADAREPFARSVELDSSYTEGLYHLAQLSSLAGDTAAALAYVRRGLDAAPEGARAPQLRVLRTMLEGRRDWTDRLDELDRADDFTVVSSVYNASVYAGRPDYGRDIARLLVRPSRPARTRGFGHLLLADLELALGRWNAAHASLAALREMEPTDADEYAALLATAPAAAPAPAEMAALRERLALAGAGAPEVSATWKPDERYGSLRRLYSRGTAAGLLGDAAELEAVLGLMATDADAVGDHAQDLRVFAAERAGLPRPAASAPRFRVPAEEAILSPFLSRPGRRYLEARRLEGLGQGRQALVWYESLVVFSVHDLPWGIPALLDRARLHEVLGEPLAAVALYRRFAELWRDAEDPAPRREALKRLAGLEGRAGPPDVDAPRRAHR